MIFNINVIICFLLSVLLLGGAVFFFLQGRKEREEGYADKINKFYNRLLLIYKWTALNFAIYSPTGERQLLILEGEKKENETEPGGILGNNLFELPFLTQEDITALRNMRQIEKQSTRSQFTDGGARNNVYHIIIKPIPDSNKFRYIVLYFNITKFIEDLEEKQRTEDLTYFASASSKVGVACYDLYTHEGFATDVWYENLSETKQKKIHPDYSRLEPQQREKIVRHLARIANGGDEPLKIDIKINSKPRAEDKPCLDYAEAKRDCKEFKINSKPGTEDKPGLNYAEAQRDCEEFKIQNGGKEKWIREFIFVHTRNAGTGALKILDLNIDITALKEGEKRLVELNAKARQAKQESDEFINSISHEVRTPLNSIVGFSGLLVNAEDPAEKEEFAQIIRRNNKMIAELMDNILNISRIDSGIVEASGSLVPLNTFLSTLCNETIRQKEGDENFKDKEIAILCELPEKETYLEIDPQLLHQVLGNLLSNAVKFTDRGSVTLGCLEQPEQIYFFVKDTGRGISPANREKIFNRFEKIDTFSQGTGLGLPLCKSIVGKLGGRMGVESEVAKGSTFWFTVPKPESGAASRRETIIKNS